jgi:hypothetical protein
MKLSKKDFEERFQVCGREYQNHLARSVERGRFSKGVLAVSGKT